MPDNQTLNTMRQDAATLFNSALGAVNAFTAIKKCCRRESETLYVENRSFDLTTFNHIYVIGAGKATALMAAAIEEILEGKITDGIINVKYGHTAPLNKITLIEAGHPIPDTNGYQGARGMIRLAERAGVDDLIICLLSGGGSALLPVPADSISLSDKQQTIATLLSCGASINEINALRKHMSMIKGGRLTETSWPATVITLIISDVVGNRVDIIASGPTVGDPDTFEKCMNIVRKYDLGNRIPPSVLSHFRDGVKGKVPDTPKPGQAIFEKTLNVVAASNTEALTAAAGKAQTLGYNPLVLSSMIEGDAREAARFHIAIAREIRKTGNPVPPPACILSGGETTVVLKGNGKGGRNQEFALTAAIEIADYDHITVLSGGTDGTDGPTDAAGAIVDTHTTHKAIDCGLNPSEFLQNNDSYHFFQKTGDLLMTGPTGTNVMDLRILLIK